MIEWIRLNRPFEILLRIGVFLTQISQQDVLACANPAGNRLANRSSPDYNDHRHRDFLRLSACAVLIRLIKQNVAVMQDVHCGGEFSAA